MTCILQTFFTYQDRWYFIVWQQNKFLTPKIYSLLYKASHWLYHIGVQVWSVFQRLITWWPAASAMFKGGALEEWLDWLMGSMFAELLKGRNLIGRIQVKGIDSWEVPFGCYILFQFPSRNCGAKYIFAPLFSQVLQSLMSCRIMKINGFTWQ